MKKTVTVEKAELGADMQSVSIRIRTAVTDTDGTVYQGKPQRRAFSAYLTDDDGNRTPNPDFFDDVDAFTGEKDFITKRLNFNKEA